MTTTQPDLASGTEPLRNGVLLRWAQYYLNEGCAVLPIVAGDKRPALNDWQVYQTCRPREDELRAWFARQEDGALGIVTGAVSNNLVILDFDGDGWEQARDELLRAFPDLRHSRRVETGSGRQHIWLRCDDLTGDDGQLLTRRTFTRPDLGEKTAIEVRANGHLTLAPPSLHPEGGRYRFLGEAGTPVVPLPNALALLGWLESWQRKGEAPPREYRPATPLDAARMRPGDDYNARGDVLPLLAAAGWQIVKQRDAALDLRRPGKSDGISATWNYYPRKLFVFTTNGAPFEADHCYDAFSVYALLEHHGDFTAAARELARQGYGQSGNGRNDVSTIPTGTPENAASFPSKTLADNTDVILQAAPLDLSLAPDLPEYARLTDAQIAAARETGHWLDAFVSFAGIASPMTPTAFHTAAGIFLGGLAIARRLFLDVSVAKHAIYPNLYMLYLGPSTVQRKSTALAVVRGLLEAAGLQHFLLADQQTPEALALDLTTRIPVTYDTWQTVVQERWLQGRALAAQRGWLLEEAAKLLDSFNRDFTSGLLPLVLDLYDCPDEAMTRNTLSRGHELVQKPYLNIFGVTTYGDMAEHLGKRKLWANGFFARFALVGSDDVGVWRFWPEPLVYPPDLIKGLRRVATQLLPMPEAYLNVTETAADDNADAPRKIKEVALSMPLAASKVQFTRDGEAWMAWEQYAKATSFDILQGNAVGNDFKASYGRLGTMLIKVAIILAAFDAPRLPVILEARHIYRAQQIVEAWRRNLHELFAKMRELHNDCDYSDGIKTVLVKAGPAWVTRRDLLRALKVKWSEVERPLADLLAGGEIEQQELKNARGPATWQYRLAIEERQ